MDQKFDFGPEEDNRIVYVRSVSSDDLPDEVREQFDEGQTLYGVYSSDGEQLALVHDRRLAFVLARQNDFSPVAVH